VQGWCKLPSKRKTRLRDDRLFQEGWFPISSDLWTDFGEIKPKLRIVADANFPSPLIKLMRNRRIDIRTAQSLGLHRLSDEDLLQKVAQRGCVLITLDRDFWSDSKFPLHQKGGIIFVDGKKEAVGESLGFELMVVFMQSFGTWNYGKFRATSKSLYSKIIVGGAKHEYEIRPIRPGIYARELDAAKS
jgi:Domain of unknown function (DUF5615)